ncbi:MAG: LysR family transcriptional regulator [Castellaniella sp.]|uniref:LysR family transcriptional regulator n=1 Tax=Castellaniella sp. TaxID=1955812 RepID=UPI0012286BA0|nr:LysR family transcriptional regulator [Castellaniella sp.]TAN27309.1 MAG: LysR family transcriptional regulator [Castellaniella sp.]
MSPSLNDIELFVEVARSQNFTRAGEALNMPASTVSRRLSQLEKSIGVRLLNRSTRKVALTPAGATYFERCRPIVEQARIAHEMLVENAQEPRGRLRVSLPSSLALAFLQSTLSEFSRRYPEIECEYDLSVRKIDLQTDGFDVVIRASQLADSGIVSHRLGVLRLGLFASPAYLQSHGTPQSPEDLVDHECLRTGTGREDSSWTLYSAHGEQRKVHVHGRMAMNHVLMLRHMAEMDAGIVPMSVRDRHISGRLVRILPQWTFKPVPLVALFPSRLLPARARVFIDFLNEQLTHAPFLVGTQEPAVG